MPPGTTRTGTVARDVRWSEGEVHVATSDGPDAIVRGDFECQRLIVTLPLRHPFSQGAYSYSLVGGADAPRSLAAPIAGTLFFAGEATADPPENGTVEGALESGLRAAHEVLSGASMALAQASHG